MMIVAILVDYILRNFGPMASKGVPIDQDQLQIILTSNPYKVLQLMLFLFLKKSQITINIT